MHPVEMDALLEGLGTGDFVKHEGSPGIWADVVGRSARWHYSLIHGAPRELHEGRGDAWEPALAVDDLKAARRMDWWKDWRP